LWERRIPPDSRHRIQLGMRCLLVEHQSGLVLIDNGAGNKESEKFHDIYGVENAAAGVRAAGAAGQGAPTQLEQGLQQLGMSPADVDIMIDTHLHFDHAGGNTTLRPDGRIVPTFPRARYVVQRGEFEYATHTNERTAASYFPDNFVPVRDAGQFDFVEGEREIVAGITVVPTPGHVPFHQGVRLTSDGETAFFLADLAPTTAHLPLPWIMGYDVEPLVTLETKRRILKEALDEHWLMVFEHDATTSWGRLAHDGKAYMLAT
jgi:glyoxylase-like metal-dependent hydrolase (beta-lactamase superfamily II)